MQLGKLVFQAAAKLAPAYQQRYATGTDMRKETGSPVWICQQLRGLGLQEAIVAVNGKVEQRLKSNKNSCGRQEEESNSFQCIMLRW